MRLFLIATIIFFITSLHAQIGLNYKSLHNLPRIYNPYDAIQILGPDTTRDALEKLLKFSFDDEEYRHYSVVKKIKEWEHKRTYAMAWYAQHYPENALTFIKQNCKPHRIDSLKKWSLRIEDYYPQQYFNYGLLLGLLGDTATCVSIMDTIYKYPEKYSVDIYGNDHQYSPFRVLLDLGRYDYFDYVLKGNLNQNPEDPNIDVWHRYLLPYSQDSRYHDWIRRYALARIDTSTYDRLTGDYYLMLWHIDKELAYRKMDEYIRRRTDGKIYFNVLDMAYYEREKYGYYIRQYFNLADSTTRRFWINDYSRSDLNNSYNNSLLKIPMIRFVYELNPEELSKHTRWHRKWFLENFEGILIAQGTPFPAQIDTLKNRLSGWYREGYVGDAARYSAWLSRLENFKSLSQAQQRVDSLDEWHFDLYRAFHHSRGNNNSGSAWLGTPAYHHLNVTVHNIIDSLGLPSSRYYLPAPLNVFSKDIISSIDPEKQIRQLGVDHFIDSANYNTSCEYIQAFYCYDSTVYQKIIRSANPEQKKYLLRSIEIWPTEGPALTGFTLADSSAGFRKVNPNLFATLPANRVTINENTLSHTTLGQVEDITVYYANHDLTLGDGFTGHGFLVVDGHLTLQGNAHWHGLVVVRHNGNTPPQLTMTDSSRITGAVALFNPLSTPAGLTLKDNVGIYFSNFVNAFILREYYGKGE